jgi:1,2-phenylacetyl-CoA epoxidase PaaB subunit
MENLVTKGFQPFHEFARTRNGHRVAYNCAFPEAVGGARVGLMFTTDSSMVRRQDGCSMQFIRHSVIMTTKSDMFCLIEKCVSIHDEHDKPMSGFVVMDVGLVPLCRDNLRDYLKLFPELFLKLLTNFRVVVEQAFEMRRQRQERTQFVLDELTRINNMIGLVRFVAPS